MPITVPTVTNSILGPIRAEIQAQLEACLASFYSGDAATRQHCFLEDSTAINTTEKPYACLAIASGKGVTYDMNSRVRPMLPVFIELRCDRNTQEGATLPNEQLDKLWEMVQKVFYTPNNWSRLEALDGFIDLNPMVAAMFADGTYGELEYQLELDYSYV